MDAFVILLLASILAISIGMRRTAKEQERRAEE
jgi:hypothetical protein